MPIERSGIDYLTCNSCNKIVSTGYVPVKTDTPDKGIIIRAYIECPECIERKENEKKGRTI